MEKEYEVFCAKGYGGCGHKMLLSEKEFYELNAVCPKCFADALEEA